MEEDGSQWPPSCSSEGERLYGKGQGGERLHPWKGSGKEGGRKNGCAESERTCYPARYRRKKKESSAAGLKKEESAFRNVGNGWKGRPSIRPGKENVPKES